MEASRCRTFYAGACLLASAACGRDTVAAYVINRHSRSAMYQPQAHKETQTSVMHELIAAHPLGALVTLGADGLSVNHLPFLLDPGAGEFGTLRAHVARANPVWQDCLDTAEPLVVFQGPHAYVSPSWYPSKHQHGRAVPTWNYAVVHAYGTPRFIDDADWLLRLIGDLSNQHEASQSLPWKVSDAPQDFIDRLVQEIVGIEIPIARLSGKWKVSQNRPQADRLGVAAGLASQETEVSRAMAALVMKALREPSKP